VAAKLPFESDEPGLISGLVLDASSGRPMRRVQVTLASPEANRPSLAVSTDDNGRFEFHELPAGSYSLGARRLAYLSSSFAETDYARLPRVFPLRAGESLEGIVMRLRPAGVIAGSVSFADGEPAIGVPVLLYVEYYFRSRHGFLRVATSLSDDRGEYRVYGLPAGRYYAMAAYTPPVAGTGVLPQPPLEEDGNATEAGPVITYFRSAHRPMEAQPIPLRQGEEVLKTDLVLATARAYAVRGLVRTASGAVGGASIRLRQPGPSGNADMDAPVAAEMLGDGTFEIVNVTPGQYTLLVDGSGTEGSLAGRLPITVAGGDVEHLEILLLPHAQLAGKVVVDDPREDVDLERVRVSLQPHSDAVSASSATGSSFSIPYIPGETYDLFVENLPPGAYVKRARMGGFEVQMTGFRPEGGSMPALDVVISTKGAVVQGAVSDGVDKAALGATVVLIPNPARGRVQHYHATTTNQYGQYGFQGVAPGRYTVVAWWDEPLCEIYNLNSVDGCRAQGRPVEVEEAAAEWVDLPVAR